MKDNKAIVVLVSSIAVVAIAVVLFDKWLTKKENEKE